MWNKFLELSVGVCLFLGQFLYITRLSKYFLMQKGRRCKKHGSKSSTVCDLKIILNPSGVIGP